MTIYHLRRSEKALTDPATLRAIIQAQDYLTLALCKDNIPYLVTLNYGYDTAANCVYFHCASEGKKMDYLRANPNVWGQIIEDHGYRPGHCDHAFRTVQFWGEVTWLTSPEAKRRALDVILAQLEPAPDRVRQQQVNDAALARVAIGKITFAGMSGKENGLPKPQ